MSWTWDCLPGDLPKVHVSDAFASKARQACLLRLSVEHADPPAMIDVSDSALQITIFLSASQFFAAFHRCL